MAVKVGAGDSNSRIQSCAVGWWTMSADIRAALKRLVELDQEFEGVDGVPCDVWDDAIDAARAALAAEQPVRLAYRLPEPVGKGPSDEELIDWYSNAYCPDVDEVNDEEDSMFQYTSAYLRWLDEHGTQEQQAAHEAKGLRAVFEAALLQQLSAPAPVWEAVPVSERLPGEGDCDAEGRCWMFMPDMGTTTSWRLIDPRGSWLSHRHWLPAHAIPLPQAGEVQA
jgi:hypothetical protein